jgi:dsDNA-specific endonuclease/ATPase MutS2
MYLNNLIKGVFMGRKKAGGDVISKKEAVEELSEKVVEAPEVKQARTMKVGDKIFHSTFAEGKIVKFITIDKIVGDFGGSLRTVTIEEIVVPAEPEIEEPVEDERGDDE